MTTLTPHDESMLRGDDGPGVALAMRIVLAVARTARAERLRSISSAHVDGCLSHGPSSLDFVAALVRGGARVQVPTTLNVGGIDLTRPDLFRGPASDAEEARAVMESYVSLGCQPTFTCAPYQLPGRPRYGEHVAWAESNAIVFGNSVLGLRTGRYGDFLDISAAITGRVPDAGLHLESNRAARTVFEVGPHLVASYEVGLLAALLGHHVGRRTGDRVPAVIGLDPSHVDEDWMKGFGAACASSGSVALFHLVGITPDAPDLASATHGVQPERIEQVTVDDLRDARSALTTAGIGEPLGGVSLGTPHMSRTRFRDVAAQLGGRRVMSPTYVSTSRTVVAQEPDAARTLQLSGVQIVSDTCTYFSRIMDPQGAVMTDSAKWAYYAPSHLGFTAVLATQAECLASALAGRIVLDGVDE